MCVHVSHSGVFAHLWGSIWFPLENYWDKDLTSYWVSWGLVFLSLKRSYMLLFLIFWDRLSPNTIIHLELGFLWFLHLNVLFPWITWLAFSFHRGELFLCVYYQNRPAKCIFSNNLYFCFFLCIQYFFCSEYKWFFSPHHVNQLIDQIRIACLFAGSYRERLRWRYVGDRLAICSKGKPEPRAHFSRT